MSEQVTPIAELTSYELSVLIAIASEAGTDEGKVGLWPAMQNADKAGLTKIGFTLGLRRLKLKTFVQSTYDEDGNGEHFEALLLTAVAWDWIEANESLFVLKREPISADMNGLAF